MSDSDAREASREVGTPARRTPYELVFSLDDFEARIFPAIRKEAQEHGTDTRMAEAFGFLGAVGDLIRQVVPDDAPPDALDQYRALLHQAFNFWTFGKRVYLFEKSVARFLVESTPDLSRWELSVPHASLYLQLPANLFWGSISTDGTPEPVDGFFVTTAEHVDPRGTPYQELQVLMVLGIRRDRAGFSVIPLEALAGAGIPPEWAETVGRPEGRDFESVLPGGELSGLYSILTTSEALKLLARALWYLDGFGRQLSLETAPERRAEDRETSVPRARLPFYRVSLADATPGSETEPPPTGGESAPGA